MLGAIAGMAPDPLRFVYPREPLNSLQRFHRWVHAKQRLTWPIGVSSQVLFAATVSGIVIGLR